MAIPKIKATYTLDVDTVRALEALAQQWSVPKSVALRRIIRDAAAQTAPRAEAQVAALEELQRALALDADAVEAWAAQVEDERVASRRVAADPGVE